MELTGATALLADLRCRGIELEAAGGRLRWRPAFLVTRPLRARIAEHRAELVRLLMGPEGECLPGCPACGRTLDAKGRCPKCFDRLCVDCGGLTGTYFVRRCVRCGHDYLRASARGDCSIDTK